eukprot:6473979-Amphidinium_carterae.1
MLHLTFTIRQAYPLKAQRNSAFTAPSNPKCCEPASWHAVEMWTRFCDLSAQDIWCLLPSLDHGKLQSVDWLLQYRLMHDIGRIQGLQCVILCSVGCKLDLLDAVSVVFTHVIEESITALPWCSGWGGVVLQPCQNLSHGQAARTQGFPPRSCKRLIGVCRPRRYPSRWPSTTAHRRAMPEWHRRGCSKCVMLAARMSTASMQFLRASPGGVI